MQLLQLQTNTGVLRCIYFIFRILGGGTVLKILQFEAITERVLYCSFCSYRLVLVGYCSAVTAVSG